MRASRGLEEITMRSLGLIAAIFLTISISACGGNSTAIGVTVTALGSTCGSVCTAPNPAIVIKGQNETFVANVSGGSTTTVYWQICLPAPITSPPTEPTNCTPIPGTTNIPPADQKLTGYGTITQTGIYTAPQSLPQQNSFVVMAASTVDYTTAFAVAYVRIDSGIRVQIVPPTTATIAEGQSYTVTANVTGTNDTALTWSVNGTVGGNSQGNIGTVTPNGPQTAVYTAPAATLTANVTATSVADSTQSATAAITVSAPANPTVTSLDPSTAQQGSAQQDVYITGTNFLSTSTVTVQGVSVPYTWITGSLIRTTIPAAQLAQAGIIPIQVVSAGNVSPVANLTVSPMRPSVVAAAVDSVSANSSGFGLSLAGGYFVPGVTTANFNGFSSGSVATTIASSRQLTVNLPASSLETPGLYPIVVQNSGLPAGASSTSAINLAVTPAPGSLLTSPTNTVTVGSSPSAIAVDQADGLALVANTGSNSVSIINLSNFAVTSVAVGNSPTGVAVDDALLAPLHHLAVVVNSADNTYSVIDLSTLTVTQTVSLVGLTPNTAAATSSPYSVGINPVTHRGFIADTSTNSGTVIDMVTPNSTLSCATAPCPVTQLGGPPSSYGTGPQPQVSVDPNLNWAVVSSGAGGIGIVNMVDLGRATVPGVDPGRPPMVTAAFAPTGPLGVSSAGVNSETHQVLITIPSNGNFTLFSLLDQTVTTIPFTNQGVAINQPGYVAAAVSALPNVGVAVNSNGNTAAILDLQNHLVIENVTVGSNPVAVAIDAATNQALVANQGDGTVSVLSLGTIRSTASGASQAPQITLLAPGITYTSANNLTLTVNGGGFAAGAQVFLDGTAVASAVAANGRQIVATVPASMLSGARRYSVYVQNSVGAAISNIEPLIVVQPVSVGNAPYGVGLDTDCDVAAVTNSADNTVSIISLNPNAAPPGKTCVGAGTVGTVGSPVSVGTAPEGIDVEPRFGLAVVANSNSLDSSVVDLTEVNPPISVALCGGGCTGVAAVAFNHDTATAEITDVETASDSGNLSGVTVSLSNTGVPTATGGTGASGLDLTPTDVAVDPYIQYLAVTTAGQTSNIDILNLMEGTRFDITNLTGLGVQVPSGVIFDPVNQVFVVANSLVNNVIFVDPVTETTSSSQVGMNPTSLDYDYQNSTLVTANNASNTLSIVDYICPPSIFTSCSGPVVREILPFSGSPQFSVKVDAKLNLAILADESNNRVLLIPLR